MNEANPQLLLQLVNLPTVERKLVQRQAGMEMPFGKFKGRLLCNLPVSYLEWFNRKGFPEGKLGMLLQTIYETCLPVGR